MSEDTLLELRDLEVGFPIRRPGVFRSHWTTLRAVSGFNLALRSGETVGIVGESGCGKSTLARAVLRLVEPSDGRIVWLGTDLGSLPRRAMDARRDQLQIVFQDPLSSHNPRMTVGAIVSEPLLRFRPELSVAARDARVMRMLARVGLEDALLDRYPHELSGGQCQRVAIARAMILEPKLLVCDEPVSALDVSTRAQILNLIRAVQAETQVSIIFISHDLSVVRYLCRRVIVMYLGRIVEQGTRETLFSQPVHPYTRALLASIPVPDPRRRRAKLGSLIRGELPSPIDPPSGCPFRTRCPSASPACIKTMPALEPIAPEHAVACHHWQDEANTP